MGYSDLLNMISYYLFLKAEMSVSCIELASKIKEFYSCYCFHDKIHVKYISKITLRYYGVKKKSETWQEHKAVFPDDISGMKEKWGQENYKEKKGKKGADIVDSTLR